MQKRHRIQMTMDRFLVHSPRASPDTSPTKTPQEGVLKQATLESLRGVVVLEEMERAKVVLERKDVSSELKVDTLQHLLCKTPAKEVLIRTKLGKTVQKLCRHENTEVAAAAQQVYKAWKSHILSKIDRPYIEVKCDLKTQRLRDSGRKMLFEALQRETEQEGDGEHKTNIISVNADACNSSKDSNRLLDGKEAEQSCKHSPKQKQVKEDKRSSKGKTPNHKRPREVSDVEIYPFKEEEDKNEPGTRDHKKAREDNGNNSMEMLAEHLERKVYHNTHRRADNSYRRSMRSLVFALRNQGDIRKAVISATLSVEDFVKQHMKK